MYDVYQHKILSQYRTIVPKDAPFPAEGKPQNWQKAKTVETIWPEAQEQIDRQGYYVYLTTVTFQEIENVLP